jgi:hypothetical protein
LTLADDYYKSGIAGLSYLPLRRIYRLPLPRLSIGKLASSLHSKTILGMAAAKAPASAPK